jgi:hypothetical protein
LVHRARSTWSEIKDFRMKTPSAAELHELRSACADGGGRDVAVHWQSAFGLIVIEVRQGRTYVNGDLVQPAPGAPSQPNGAEQ